MKKIRKDDLVEVIAGKDKGKRGKVLMVTSRKGRNMVIVDGVNIIKKHRKKTQGVDGGIVSFESFIDASNIALVCPKKDVITKVGIQIQSDGKKSRVSKASGNIMEKS